MLSSSAVVSPSPSQPSHAGGDEGQDEIEYDEIEEEIEVEEEVEVEEGAEEEVVEGKEEDGDGSEIGEDLTPVREENNLNDTDQDMELEQDEEHLNSDPLTMRMSVVNPQLNIATNQEFCGGFLSPQKRKGAQKEELCTIEKITFRDTDAKACLDGNLEANDINNKTFWSQGNATLTITDACSQKNGGVGSAVAKPLQTAIEGVTVMKETTSRLSGPPITPRDSSSGAEFDVANKKPRILCEFHAKGWCIRGKSCRFLHIKEGVDAAGQKHDLLAGGLDQAGKIHIGQNSGLDDFNCHTSPSIKCHSIDMNRALRGNFSGVSCDTYDKSKFFSFGTEETVSKKNELVPHAHRLNLPFYSRPPVPFGSSSWTTNADAIGTWNTLKSNQEYRASISSSFRKSPSPLSGSNSGCLSGNNNLTNKQPTKNKTKIFPDGWEPSVPFRPSHVVTQNLLLKESPYDHILHSVEQTGAKDGPFEFAYSDPGVYVNDAHFQSNKLQKEELLDANHVEDTRKASRLSSGCDNGLKLDETTHQKELQMDGCGKKTENGVIKRDENVQNESKALKYFHAALVEYVKELVKPSWKEGLMSKDAHKIIVKKAVDKVLSTLQHDQIPNTAESIKSYLSISQVKLSNLVEGYIEKYGKF
ncbi:protein FRIGIDA-ESSENTIAL 1-like [Primulina huaijiensis]|uniref:protein FRIGIDA-ESSENTIAL 1-like n=1 Tax=Primulina huaijiensis TaxID=1492673 RepID=UPI003CC7589A